MRLIRDTAGIRLLQPPLPGKSSLSHQEDPLSAQDITDTGWPLCSGAGGDPCVTIHRVWHSSHSTRAEALPGLVWHSDTFLAPKGLPKLLKPWMGWMSTHTPSHAQRTAPNLSRELLQVQQIPPWSVPSPCLLSSAAAL